MDTQPASLSYDKSANTLRCKGSWTVAQVSDFLKNPPSITATDKELSINGSQISHMDTTGAWALQRQELLLKNQGITVTLFDFNDEHKALLKLVEYALPAPPKAEAPPEKSPFVYSVGKRTVKQFFLMLNVLSFFGQVSNAIAYIFTRPYKLQYKSFLNTIDQTGFRALPIVGLLCFLIGIVLAYQTGQQLQTYGANIYIVSLLGIGMLQEFGPLIAAIIVAGRTSSSFTAQIGTMKLNEEVDAMRTMGLSPVLRLVVPKVLGLIVALPLLILWADIFGVAGGMIVADQMLGVSYANFLISFPQMIELQTLINGLLKGPFFALIIACVGCYQGFKVESSADSVGKRTTTSVVQSIFLIIVADAIFSIVQSWQGI